MGRICRDCITIYHHKEHKTTEKMSGEKQKKFKVLNFS